MTASLGGRLPGGSAEARRSVRNAGFLVAQWGAQVAAGVAFAALVPRLMGPEVYGRYSLLVSVSLWFVLAASLGLLPVMGRYVPEMRSDPARLREFFGRMLTLRLASGAAAAVLFLGAVLWWFPGLDGAAAALAAVSVLAQSLATLYFALFLGLNRADLWGLEAPLKSWGVVAALPAAYLVAGLRGACGALAVVDVALLAFGVLLARASVGVPGLRWDLRPAVPYLRFGAGFLVSQLVVASFRRSGDVMVLAFSGTYAEVGYFGLAMNVYLVGALAMGQLALSFAPLLTGLREEGRPRAAARWAERLLVVLVAGGTAAVFGALALGDTLVPLVFGSAYGPVADHLLVMALALAAMAPVAVGRLLSVVLERPRTAAAAAAVQLGGFWIAGPPLVAWRGGIGGCAAVLIATVLGGAYFLWRLKGPVGCSLRAPALASVLGLPFLPVLALGSGWMWRAAACAVCLGAYAWVLERAGVVTRDECRSAWRAVREGLGRRGAAGSREWG